MHLSRIMERIGDYKIEREVENGYEARHLLLPRTVHLAVARPTFAGTRPAAVRMMREAFILEALQHPGVPRVYETGILADGRIQLPWVATELVAGVSLAESAEADEALTVVELVELLGEVAAILAHAHAIGIAHRRIRPEAILRCTGRRSSGVCVVRWSDAAIVGEHEHAELAFADDVLALGVVADGVLDSHTDVPASLRAVVDAMTSTDLASRPRASEIAEACSAIRAALEQSTEVDVDLDDLLDMQSFAAVVQPVVDESSASLRAAARGSVPPPVPASSRMRWTPPAGYDQAVVEAAARAVASERNRD